jgi:hypothetical protein
MHMTGGCACGAKRFAVTLPTEPHAYLCHCRMCQRASGNVSLAMVGVREADVRWTGEQPDWYRSSPIATRPFCCHCGTSLGFRYDEASAGGGPTEKMDLTVASFDDPSIFTPQSHFGAESMLRAWLDTKGLPETRSDDYAPLQSRWEKAE